MEKKSEDSGLNRMSSKQLKAMRLLTESGDLEKLLNDSKPSTSSKTSPSNSTKRGKRKPPPMEASLMAEGLSLEEANDWLSEI